MLNLAYIGFLGLVVSLRRIEKSSGILGKKNLQTLRRENKYKASLLVYH